MKRLLIPALLFMTGCKEYAIQIKAEQPVHQIQTLPTTLPSEEVVLCLSKELVWAKEIAYQETRSRFKRFVVVIVDSSTNSNKEWVATPDNENPVDMDTFGLSMALKYKDRDIVIFANNPNKAKLTSPRVWYFEQDIFLMGQKSYCPIWRAVTQWGYTLEK